MPNPDMWVFVSKIEWRIDACSPDLARWDRGFLPRRLHNQPAEFQEEGPSTLIDPMQNTEEVIGKQDRDS